MSTGKGANNRLGPCESDMAKRLPDSGRDYGWGRRTTVASGRAGLSSSAIKAIAQTVRVTSSEVPLTI